MSAPVMAAGGDTTPLPLSVAGPVYRARRALGNVVDHLAAGRYPNAAKALLAVQKNLAAAHKAGTAQIGAAPADPESDQLPGPPSVVAVLGLDHRVAVRTARLLDGMTVKVGLGTTLSAATKLRLVMLSKVLSLDPEGAGGDYTDDLTDTLPIYAAEVLAVSDVLRTGRLTASSRRGLTNNLVRIKQATAEMNAAYGGGE
jgi:hypothetical protein